MSATTGNWLRERGPTAAVWALGAVSLSVLVVRLHGFYQDDAFISLTYARNLIEGHGLSWNPGERIEGYSNFSFVMLVAGLRALGLDLVVASRLIGVFFGVATVVASASLYAEARRASRTYLESSRERPLAALHLVLVATSLPLVAWSFGGLETTLFAFLVTMGVRGALTLLDTETTTSPLTTGIWFGLATLTRPDGGVFWMAVLLFLAAKTPRPAWPRVVAPVAAGTLLVLVPYLAWKLWYFGELVPNTYFAKSYGIPQSFKLSAGIDYFWSFVGTPPALPLFAAAALALRRLSAPRGPAMSLAVTCCAIFIAYQILVGGDFMEHFRFFAPLIPLLALILVGVARELAAGGRERLAVALGLTLLALTALPLITVEPHPGSTSDIVAQVAGPYLEEKWPAGALIGINASGALPYLQTRHRYIDMLGLNDTHIARRRIDSPQGQVGHLKGDGAYVLSREPDVLLLGFPYGADEAEPVFLGDREIVASPELEARYRKVTASLDVPGRLRGRLTAAANLYPHLRYSQGKLLFTYYERLDD